MRYILDNNGYIEEVSFDALITCNNKDCIEYTGSIPTGYSSLEDWASNSDIRAFFIQDNDLVYDSQKDADLQQLWENEIGIKDNEVNIITGELRIQAGITNITPTKKKTLTTKDITFTNEFNTLPLVTITPAGELTNFYVSDITKTGMKINIYSDSTNTVNIYWEAKGRR